MITAMIMTATRVNGVMFLPALALIGWDAASTGRERRWALAAAISGAAGIAAYSWFVYSLSGNPFEWYDSITRWGYHPGGNPLSGLVAIARQLATRPMEFIATERMAPYDTLNAMAAAGVVSLPGMMTGQIMAGAPPVEAVKYQILIMFLISVGTGLGTLTAVTIGSRRLFDQRQRLCLDRLREK